MLSLTTRIRTTSSIHAMQALLVTTFAAVVLLTAPVANAHDTWIVPKRWAMKANEMFAMSLTSGMAFPKPGHLIDLSRVKQSFAAGAGGRFVLINASAQPNALEVRGGVGGTGVFAGVIELYPKTLELKPKLIREYLDEIGASDSLKKAWSKPSKTMRWRERYSKHAKTYVAMSANVNASEAEIFKAAEQDTLWKLIVELPLEIVPDKNPMAIHAGDSLSVRVLKQGKPLAGFMLNMVREGDKKGVFQRTNDEGRVMFVVKKAGQYLLHGTELRFINTPDIEVESDFTTLTLLVRR